MLFKRIIIVLLIVFSPANMFKSAQKTQFVLVSFSTQPKGATLIVDGQGFGITDLTQEMTPGIHTIELNLAGYKNWVRTIVVYGSKYNVFAELQNGPQANSTQPEARFVELSNGIGLQRWDTMTNRLQFQSDEGNSNPQMAYDYDIDKAIFISGYMPFNTLEDINLRQQLNISKKAPRDVYSAAYRSPSGRYIAFVPKGELSPPRIAIYDAKTKTLIKTDVQLTEQSDLQLVWSQNERVMWLQWFQDNTPILVFVGEAQAKTMTFGNFISESDKYVSMDGGGIFTRASDAGFAILWGQTEDDQSTHPWLVNLLTSVGVPLPFENVMNAIFSPDGQWIYVAVKEGIKRVKTSDLRQIELVTDDVSAKNGIFRVDSISYTLDYALVERAGVNTNFFLYKMPPH